MIPFNIPFISGDELQYIEEAIQRKDLTGDGYFGRRGQLLLENLTACKKVMLTGSCTHALEISAMLADIQPGDEVIMPSFTFVSSANAFVLRGAKIVFVDIRPDTMNIDEKLIEAAITKKTKAILVMHYAGISCEMDAIMAIAQAHNLIVIEDAAHCIGAYYKNKHLGTIGHLGTLSFHSTKNIHCGEGGALFINDDRFSERAEIIRDKGTNRKAFLKGMVDKYSWVNMGSSYLMSELNAAFLYGQLLNVELVNEKRITQWHAYLDAFQERKDRIPTPFVPSDCKHNGHVFYVKCKNLAERHRLIGELKDKAIEATFHYVPLHSSIAGKKYGIFKGNDNFTTKESERLLRLPLYFNLENTSEIATCLKQFYQPVWK